MFSALAAQAVPTLQPKPKKKSIKAFSIEGGYLEIQFFHLVSIQFGRGSGAIWSCSLMHGTELSLMIPRLPLPHPLNEE
jgi:hypothetical protein